MPVQYTKAELDALQTKVTDLYSGKRNLRTLIIDPCQIFNDDSFAFTDFGDDHLGIVGPISGGGDATGYIRLPVTPGQIVRDIIGFYKVVTVGSNPGFRLAIVDALGTRSVPAGGTAVDNQFWTEVVFNINYTINANESALLYLSSEEQDDRISGLLVTIEGT